MAKRYRRLKGNTAYLPFGARTDLRAGQRRTARWLRRAGVAALGVAALLFIRQNVLHGGQPTLPALAVVPSPAPRAMATAESAAVSTSHVEM